MQPLPFATLDESYPMINGRGYPDTVNTGAIVNTSVQERLGLAEPWPSQKISSLITATKGQYILLRINNVSLSDYHTISVLGIPMRVVGKDANLLRGPDPMAPDRSWARICRTRPPRSPSEAGKPRT